MARRAAFGRCLPAARQSLVEYIRVGTCFVVALVRGGIMFYFLAVRALAPFSVSVEVKDVRGSIIVEF